MPIATPAQNGSAPAQPMEAALAEARENPSSRKPKVDHTAVRVQSAQRAEPLERPAPPAPVPVPALQPDIERARQPDAPRPAPIAPRPPRDSGQEKVREREPR